MRKNIILDKERDGIVRLLFLELDSYYTDMDI